MKNLFQIIAILGFMSTDAQILHYDPTKPEVETITGVLMSSRVWGLEEPHAYYLLMDEDETISSPRFCLLADNISTYQLIEKNEHKRVTIVGNPLLEENDLSYDKILVKEIRVK